MSDLSKAPFLDSKARPVRAPRGPQLSCANWQIEAAFRMIQNNLDPAVAENPDELVVYGDIGKAARNWPCFDAILEGVVMVCDATAQAAERIERVLWNDPATGVMRHADADYELARQCARDNGLKLPMLGGGK